jgi:hypothetical protein
MSALDRSSQALRILAAALAAIAFEAVVSPPPASAEIAAIASRQRAEKKTFTDSEIVEGFMTVSESTRRRCGYSPTAAARIESCSS